LEESLVYFFMRLRSPRATIRTLVSLASGTILIAVGIVILFSTLPKLDQHDMGPTALALALVIIGYNILFERKVDLAH
jgi:divalent metal cation (Fe/Co/Zn/Cd) transporter